jgi:hypothetical protein
VTLWQRRLGARIAAPDLDAPTARALCALAAAMATDAPALLWCEPEVFEVPEPLGAPLARALLARAEGSHVVLREPPAWLEAALATALAERGGASTLRAERVTAELGDRASALTAEKFGSLTGLSSVP